MTILERLFTLQDIKYKEFNDKLIPNISSNTTIGIKIPNLRKLSKELLKENNYNDFISKDDHQYFEEKLLHGFLLEKIDDFDEAIKRIELFLPMIDNWAISDTVKINVFKKHKDLLINYIYKWLESDHIYTQRFAIVQLMRYYLDEDFKCEYLEKVSNIKSDEYYLKMVISWYFATSLSKNYEETIPYIENHKLDTWVHNKTIQKACESYRVSNEKKEYLRHLKIKA